MAPKRPLTGEEEKRCIEFLAALDVTSPDHPILSDRGYFGIFLCGLSPEEVGTDHHPSVTEFRETVRLLAIAGIEELRSLVKRSGARGSVAPDPPSGSGGMKPAIPVPHAHTRAAMAAQQQKLALQEKQQQPQPRQQPTPPPQPSEPPPPPQPAPDPPSSFTPKPGFHREIKYEEPSAEARERLRNLEHADSIPEAITLARSYAAERKYHDAYHILVDYILQHQLDEHILKVAAELILEASQFDRDHAIPPINMLWECEEMAAVLARKLPDMSQMAESGDARTQQLYHCVRLVYKTWTAHSQALLEYKYRLSTDQWVRRNWIDPRDFGFLSEAMRMAVRSRLPLDLLRFVLSEIKKCIDIGRIVIAHDDKRARFEGDVLRIIASPTKDIIPDLTFEIFRDIVNCYLDEGDSQNAIIFCKQALLLRRNDRDMNMLKTQLLELGAGKSRESLQKLKLLASDPGPK